jgi:geranylgeranyl pyrophosphate synthase
MSPRESAAPVLAGATATDDVACLVKDMDRRLRGALDQSDGDALAPARPFLLGGGKRIRARFAFAAGAAVGAPTDAVVELAAALELIHAFSLVHDDIEDAAPLRRGRPSLHVGHGVPIALNCGDALYTLAWQRLLHLEVAPPCALAVARAFASGLMAAVEGQARDLAWSAARRPDVCERDHLRMIERKTGALLALACESPAHVASSPHRRALCHFGRAVGVAFQIRDDLLGLSGDPDRTGKQTGGDLAQGKLSLALIHCRANSAPSVRERFDDAFRAAAADVAARLELTALAARLDSFAYAERIARRYLARATAALHTLPPGDGRESLFRLARAAVDRNG